MSRENWALIKSSKNFNVNVYRRGLMLLILSTGLSTIIALLMFYVYVHLPERDYYATNGVTPPIKLTALSAPNESSKALLDPDPPIDDIERVIPQ